MPRKFAFQNSKKEAELLFLFKDKPKIACREELKVSEAASYLKRFFQTASKINTLEKRERKQIAKSIRFYFSNYHR